MSARGLALAAALCLAPAAASARDLPTGGMTLADVQTWLQGRGLNAAIQTASDGKQHVEVTSAKDPNFGVYLFDCKAERCGSLQFSGGFVTHGAFPAGTLNNWNRDKRWGRAYSDSSNDPWVEMDVDLTPGGVYELLDDNLDTWGPILRAFATYIRWTK
jgi:hypothetical protein